MIAESTVAGTTSVTGTASAIGTGAGTAVVKGGAFMGKKYLIGIIATLTLGAGGVGVAAAIGNLNLDSLFKQDVVMEEEYGQENQDILMETEVSEETEMVFDSYADVVSFMQTPEYRVDTAEYIEDAIP